jgi:hypothetical protein
LFFFFFCFCLFLCFVVFVGCVCLWGLFCGGGGGGGGGGARGGRQLRLGCAFNSLVNCLTKKSGANRRETGKSKKKVRQ